MRSSAEQFGQAIANFQMIHRSWPICMLETEAARLLVYRAAEAAQRSSRGGKGTELIRKKFAIPRAETATWVCDQAVQIHGGYGYCLEFPVQKLWVLQMPNSTKSVPVPAKFRRIYYRQGITTRDEF